MLDKQSTTSAASRATPPRAGSDLPKKPSKDAIVLLKSDHADVKKCFKQYAKLAKNDAPSAEKAALAGKICKMLTVHAQIEEEIFYPAARDLLGDDASLVDEADVEHASAKDLIGQIQSSDPSEMHYDAKVKVLGEYIDHHVKEKQDELFPAVKGAGMDTKAVGQQLLARKAELQTEVTS